MTAAATSPGVDADALDAELAAAPGPNPRWVAVSAPRVRWPDVAIAVADLRSRLRSVGLGNRLRWDGAVAETPPGSCVAPGSIGADVLAHALEVRVLPDSVLVLGERAGATFAVRLTTNGYPARVSVWDAQTTRRMIARTGRTDRALERCAIAFDVVANTPDELPDGLPSEVVSVGDHIGVVWQTSVGPFVIWTDRHVAGELDTRDAAAAVGRIGHPPGSHLSFRRAPIGFVGANLTSSLDPGEVVDHRWIVIPQETR